MEWCVVLYGDRQAVSYMYRFVRVVIVFLATLSAAMWIGTQPASGSGYAAYYTKTESVDKAGMDEKDKISSLADTVSWIYLGTALLSEKEMKPEGATDVTAPPILTADDVSDELPDVSRIPAAAQATDGILPGTSTKGAEEDHTPDTAPGAVTVSDAEMIAPLDTESGMTNAETGAESGIPGAGNSISSDITADIPGRADVPETPVESEDAVEDPAGPSDSQLPGNEATPGTVGGFLVDSSGIICGIADPAAIVSDGYLALPSEGCSGIASGVFAQGFAGVREIYIPGNITRIEEGAFAGLTNMEWYEADAGGPFYTSEGVLYSENGTCILAFPAGRTGIYRVPPQVERIASGAFADAKITGLDLSGCPMADVGEIPTHISIIRH